MIHKLVLLTLTILAMLLPSTASAYTGPIKPPTLVKGQYVYTHGCSSTYEMTQRSLEGLNHSLSDSHYPFYVVMMCDLVDLNEDQRAYARRNGFTGDPDDIRISTATAMLMEDWADENEMYDMANTAVFVISFNPRKFAWHPALRAKNFFGLDHQAQQKYVTMFLNGAKHSPPDYAGGIAFMANAYDEWYFDQSDPARIAAREQARIDEAKRERLKTAQGKLDAEILNMAELLKQKEFIPDDVTNYNAALSNARVVRAFNEPGKMLEEAVKLHSSVEVLGAYVNKKQAEARSIARAKSLKWAGIIGVLMGALTFICVRRREEEALIAQWDEIYIIWDTKVTNAHARWVDHYLKRDDIMGLDGVTGQTKALWDATTQKVDEILVRIRAMQQHAENCEKIFKRGSFLRLQPYRDAIAAFDQPFEFDTGVINEADLFGGETVTLTVDPTTFTGETASLFQESIDGWHRLQKAASERHGEACDDFPHGNMDELFKVAAEHGIPERWFESHPLFGDDDSDTAFYKSLDDIRLTDPLAYVERIEAVIEAENALLDNVERIVAALGKVAKARVPSVSDTHGTVVQADDDPTVTLAVARQAEDRLTGMLATATDVADIEQQAARVVDLYRKAVTQGVEIASAVKGARGALDRAKAKGTAVGNALGIATGLVQSAAKVHQRIQPANDDLIAGQRFIKKGEYNVEQAEQALVNSMHLDARRLADTAHGAYVSATARIKEAMEHCMALDAEKTRFEEKMASMEGIRSRYARRMSDYSGYERSLASVVSYDTSGLTDYAERYRALDQQESAWRRAVRQAESVYEEEQRRIRRERERREAEARHRREAERRRQSSYSSPSSSSSSSFGGGGFGGSSSSFGGGGGFGGSSGSF